MDSGTRTEPRALHATEPAADSDAAFETRIRTFSDATHREKLEAPAVIRGIIAASARVVDLLAERRLLQDDEMLGAAAELRRRLEALEEIRTSA